MVFFNPDRRSRAISIETAAPAARADFSTDALATRDLPTVTSVQRGARYAKVPTTDEIGELARAARKEKQDANESFIEGLAGAYEAARTDLLRRISQRLAGIPKGKIADALKAAAKEGSDSITRTFNDFLFQGKQVEFENLAPKSYALPHAGFGIPAGSRYAAYLSGDNAHMAILPITSAHIEKLDGYKIFLGKLNERNTQKGTVPYTAAVTRTSMSTPGNKSHKDFNPKKNQRGFFDFDLKISYTVPEAST